MINRPLQGSALPVVNAFALSNVPAVNTNAVVTKVPATTDTKQRVIVHYIQASYNAAPTGGRLTVSDGTTTFIDLDIFGTLLTMDCFIPCAIGGTLTVTLFGAGAAVQGKLNVQGELATLQ